MQPNTILPRPTGERNMGAPTAPATHGSIPTREEMAEIVRYAQPSGVWIDLATNRVELARPERPPLAFLFSCAADTLGAGLSAEMARREIAAEPVGALRCRGRLVRHYRRR